MTERLDYFVFTPRGRVRLPDAASDQAAIALAKAYSNQHLGGAAVRVLRRVTNTIDVAGQPNPPQGGNPNG